MFSKHFENRGSIQQWKYDNSCVPNCHKSMFSKVQHLARDARYDQWSFLSRCGSWKLEVLEATVSSGLQGPGESTEAEGYCEPLDKDSQHTLYIICINIYVYASTYK